MKNNYLSLGGLFASLHVLFLFLSKVVVGSEVILVVFLPLLSTLYTLKSDKKSIIMFVIATILVCGIFDIVGTFIYVIPSLVCGVLYGNLRKKKAKELELLCFSSLGHIFSLLFSFGVIAILFKEISFLGIFESIFGLNGEKLVIISLCFLVVLGFAEAFLVHVVCDNELEKLASRVEKNEKVPKSFLCGFSLSFIVFLIMYFVNVLYSVLPLIISLVFVIPYIVYGVINLKYKYLTACIICFFSLISIFFIKYIDPLVYFGIPVFMLLPFVINNFKDIEGKNF